MKELIDRITYPLHRIIHTTRRIVLFFRNRRELFAIMRTLEQA